ncbi:lactonase family protein [bacterium]|nr:lactonase family protein [bacterium]MDC0258830.1 lactonase family protein [Verrucomicrobiales bacterium]
MKWFSLASLFVFLSALSNAATFVYVSESKDKKIAVFSLDEKNGDLTRVGEIEMNGAPGCLALSPDRKKIYASVRSVPEYATLEIDPKTGLLKSLAVAPAAGSAAYIYPDKTGKWLLAASYGEGNISVSKIVDGTVTGEPIQIIETGKKAHCIQTDPANKFVFTPHAGELNKVEQHKFDATTGKLESNEPSHLEGAEGAGPRHMQFHPNQKWAYLVNEQDKSVTHCDYDSATGLLTKRKTLSTHPEGWDQKGSCADIEISGDGKFVYASNRGHNSIAGFSIDQETGKLTALGQTPTADTPRSFNLIEDGETIAIRAGQARHSKNAETFMVAAGQKGSELVVYRRDVKTGALTKLKTYPCGQSPAWVMGVKM